MRNGDNVTTLPYEYGGSAQSLRFFLGLSHNSFLANQTGLTQMTTWLLGTRG